MKSKNILLAGLAVGVLAAATGAQALTLSGSSIGGVSISSSATVTPYTVASEATIPGGGLTGPAVLDTHLVTGNVTNNSFLVTYTLSGATFNTSGLTGSSLSYIGVHTNTSANVSTFNSTSVSFIVTVGGTDSISDFILSIPVIVTTAGSVSLTEAITQGGNPVDNSPVTATIIKFAQGYTATVASTTANNQIASIASNFKLFKANPGPGADTATATIGTITTAVATITGGATGSPFKNLTGTSAVIGDITGVSVVATGQLGATETLTVAATTVPTGTTATVVPGNGAMTVALNQTGTTPTPTTGTAVPLIQTSYSATATPQLGAGLTQSAAVSGAGNLGKVTYEGVNFNAAWVGDGVTNASQDYRIRVGNNGGSAITTAVQVTLLNPSIPGTSGTVFSTAPCTVANGIPAAGSVTISSAALKTCFGAFGNSDLIVTVQASSQNLSAKMRVINSLNSLVTEQSLGFGVTVATQP